MDPLPLSALNDHLYGQRRAALKFIEGLRDDNEHTATGSTLPTPPTSSPT